jgi:thiol-disulfide isomerase/thioredoxin
MSHSLTLLDMLETQPFAPASLSRRRLMRSALALATAAAAAPYVLAQSTAYKVSSWAGPVSVLELSDITGKIWRPADLKGRPALLNFWASWCEPCRAEMPSLQQIADLYGSDTLMLDDQGRARLRVIGEVDWTSPAAEKLIASLSRA